MHPKAMQEWYISEKYSEFFDEEVKRYNKIKSQETDFERKMLNDYGYNKSIDEFRFKKHS